jgi:protein involved in polysaccharide export with SLBB domain
VAAFALGSTVAAAQQPTAQQVKSALATRPELAATLRERIGESGLAPDQIRARLKAAGYPENLLDSYMSGTTSSDSDIVPSDSALRAVRFLGLVDSLELAAGDSAKTAQLDNPPGRVSGIPVSETSPKVFGADVFRRSTSQFEADLAGPVDANYRVGPRDVLALILTGGVENSYTLEVTREGFVVVPTVGQVYVANLTLEQVNDVMYDKLRRVYSGIGRGANAATHFYVTVAKLRTNQVFVLGEATVPGSYQVASVGTMLTALYRAGGPTSSGTFRNVELRRGGTTISHLDIYDYLLRGDAAHDARLENGDVLFVPMHGPRVQVNGAVNRPAIYELKENETLRDLIRMAGGFAAEAGRLHVLVRRIVPADQRPATGGRDRTVLDISSSDLAVGFGPAFPLEDGDIVEVPTVPNRVRNQIVVNGAVWNPGVQGFQTGMRLSDALRRAGGVKPDVRDVLISRLQSDQSREALRTSFTDSLGSLATDIALQEDDSVRVYAASDFRPERYVRIGGAVNKSGVFAWKEGMTLRDLVHLAGGFDDGAYLVKAEVARLPSDRKPGELATTIPVMLDSSYLLERGLDGKYVGPVTTPPTLRSTPPFELQPYDNVLILREPDWQLDRTVSISGEVRFPGVYTLKSKQQTVDELVNRAGGLTSRAYPDGAVFTRTAGKVGRIGLNLAEALKDSSYKDNILLLAGDALYIPDFRPTVKVEGAVQSPIAVAYVPGKHLSYYLDAAGGISYNGDQSRAFVRQPNGLVEPYKKRWFIFPDADPVPRAGSAVVVPSKDPNDKKDWTAIVGSLAQVTAGLVAIIAISKR